MNETNRSADTKDKSTPCTAANSKNPHRYDDMLDMPHHTSPKHPRMSAHSRAAQFAPFAALTKHTVK